MILDVGGVEDGLHVWQILLLVRARLVVNNADLLFAAFCIGDTVEAVNDTTYLRISQRHAYVFLQSEDGEGGKLAIEFKQLSHVSDDDLTVDQLHTVEGWHLALWVLNMEELSAEGFIDSLFHLYIVFQHIVNNKTGDTLACEFRLSLVDVLYGFVEDIAKGTIVDEFIISLVRFQQIAYVVVEESQLAAQVGTDGSRTDATRLGSEALLQDRAQAGY